MAGADVLCLFERLYYARMPLAASARTCGHAGIAVRPCFAISRRSAAASTTVVLRSTVSPVIECVTAARGRATDADMKKVLRSFLDNRGYGKRKFFRFGISPFIDIARLNTADSGRRFRRRGVAVSLLATRGGSCPPPDLFL